MMHKRYLLWLLLFCCCTLLPATALNLLLLKNEGDIASVSYAASDWQHQTHGITYSPMLGHNALFKTLRLNDRLAETDAVIFGSSTGMSIDSTMMPLGWHLYNFTQSGSPLSASIAQAEYLVNHAPQITHFIISLDWSLNLINQSAITTPADLSLPKRNSTVLQQNSLTTIAMLKDAVSYPRMAKLWQALVLVALSPQPLASFHEYFLQVGSNEYICPDGTTTGRDFGINNRRVCDGFRYDGSATYAGLKRVDDQNRLIISALSFGSKYAQSLLHTKGILEERLFDRLSELNKAIARKGGVLILYMPPLVPGLESALLKHPQLSAYLLRTKQELAKWAQDKPVVLADFGQSEKFGCVTSEFLDEHHADGNCYRKIFSDFWQNGGIQKKLADSARANSGK